LVESSFQVQRTKSASGFIWCDDLSHNRFLHTVFILYGQ